ncbi:uncharacterized protein LOC18440126 isoform X1 [Amborella trichopoda]|uniref:uncharacterized protein LOC18440126 isoform X1 n=1 Tax=Amborella trichopoda TaxID=13333 RepID=UPI0009BD54F3|nr:uncharacterized protein LOC18440126 isoform X1 [Amborella trichopoda]|eukprot:XP_020526574.1 uncharacterized protein LOC18440126 isoform X1 [Amborella trichopoda]
MPWKCVISHLSSENLSLGTGTCVCLLLFYLPPKSCRTIHMYISFQLKIARYRLSYNIAPGAYLPVLRKEQESKHGYVVHCMKWGLVPSFTKKTEKPDHFKMFNARSESIQEKASFRRLVPNKRCLVVVEGFYEWKKDGSKKQPYYLHFRDGRALVFAGLYDTWENSEGEGLYTFTILTTRCSSALDWLHDRMPVILGNKEAIDAWLNITPSPKVDSLLQPYEGSDLVWYPVTPAMGKIFFAGPECIKEIQLKSENKNTISKLFMQSHNKKQPISEPSIRKAAEDSTHGHTFENSQEPSNTNEDWEPIDDFKVCIGIKREASPGNAEETEKRRTKRDIEQLLVDPKKETIVGKENPISGEERQGYMDRGSHKNGMPRITGGKQANLFSYFGKS